ncbi:hypothetical protein EV11_0869 [Prochlorococcus sp. SS52]|nr:hypothetical protein EV04_0626 [Prochlorococcus marinus str. LG]KGG21365.1 hypothetical protein EV08_0773 [Prochlorococcus marinus str. SS2]KGG24303.1 hypothetical protein EV09_0350 [Prochlorococcus marinus str. SS35]KGG33587.1 hypothetical protein EV10_0427 [Prochlorococcus marinus str. SS51]KGG36497.1 hypothetical protein EV11_0869 [Prochlorococcus sp. SS52]
MVFKGEIDSAVLVEINRTTKKDLVCLLKMPPFIDSGARI